MTSLTPTHSLTLFGEDLAADDNAGNNDAWSAAPGESTTPPNHSGTLNRRRENTLVSRARLLDTASLNSEMASTSSWEICGEARREDVTESFGGCCTADPPFALPSAPESPLKSALFRRRHSSTISTPPQRSISLVLSPWSRRNAARREISVGMTRPRQSSSWWKKERPATGVAIAKAFAPALSFLSLSSFFTADVHPFSTFPSSIDRNSGRSAWTPPTLPMMSLAPLTDHG
mmetsp:Transcript_63070/g.186320  ORF Transcript_63070/g.186320 Transcript_63070/m.186320 type:complete len:232 (-) Transcript_63070:388-1083(-)